MTQFRSIFLAFSVFFLLLCSAFTSVTPLNFFYFFPDSVQSNFSLLTQEVYRFFDKGEIGSKFQAVTHEADFNELIHGSNPDVVLIPAWYYDRYGKSLSLTPLLTSLHEGRQDYTKVLLVRKNSQLNKQRLKGKTIAVTNMGPETAQQLNHYFKDSKLDFSKSNVIIIPKDADGYYALVLGQVDAVVVRRDTIDMVSKVNPRFVKQVQEIAVSAPIPMPILCVNSSRMDDELVTQLKQLFLESGKQSPPPSFMQMLHISGWKNETL